MIDYASDCLLGFYAICVFVVLKFEGVLNGALCLCEGESLLFWNPTFVMVEKEDKGRNYHFKVIIQVLCWNKSCGPNGITLLFFENGFTLLLSRNVVGMHFLFIVDYR